VGDELPALPRRQLPNSPRIRWTALTTTTTTTTTTTAFTSSPRNRWAAPTTTDYSNSAKQQRVNLDARKVFDWGSASTTVGSEA
jgi:hypothetical protein